MPEVMTGKQRHVGYDTIGGRTLSKNTRVCASLLALLLLALTVSVPARVSPLVPGITVAAPAAAYKE